MDRWFHFGLALHLPADVDLEAGVRRERSFYCPPQVLLRYYKSYVRSMRLLINQLLSVSLRKVLDTTTSLVAKASLYWRSVTPDFTVHGCSQNSAAGQSLGG